jgi:D-glycero-D-manno-heptose 1,7-bisphosphate phosphatase
VGIGKVRAVFLDRDGVLNEAIVRDGKPYPPRTLDEFRIVAGAAEELGKLKAAGFLLIVVTNQPDVARGTVSRETVEAFDAALRSALPVDDIFTCFHDDGDGCDCRKPKPGLLLAAAEKYGIDRESSYMIGDRWRDVDAGVAAGCRAILIDYRYEERGPDQMPWARVGSLAEAVPRILADPR